MLLDAFSESCRVYVFFPSCQVRVVRFYVSWPAASSSFSSSSSIGPPPRAPDQSVVPHRTSATKNLRRYTRLRPKPNLDVSLQAAGNTQHTSETVRFWACGRYLVCLSRLFYPCFHRWADGFWSDWLLLCFPNRQANVLIISSPALWRGKPSLKGCMLLVLHMAGQNRFVHHDPMEQGLVRSWSVA